MTGAESRKDVLITFTVRDKDGNVICTEQATPEEIAAFTGGN